MKQNIIEKIWDKHVVPISKEGREGHPDVFAIDLHLVHEVTSAQAFAMLDEKGLKVAHHGKTIATLDHSIPTRKNRLEIYDQQAKHQVETLRANTKKHGIPLFDFDSGFQGIVHVIGPELGLTHPGMTIVCGDSHTSTHGAFGALAFGIGTSEVGYVLATGCILQKKPKTMKVEFKGKFNKGVYPKDAIIKLIAEIGIAGGNGFVIEYTGSAVSEMSMEERMTVCNMSIECGARAGLMAPDQKTFDYIKGRRYAPQGADWDEAVSYWQSLVSDADCAYDKEVTIDVDALRPMVTWGTNPEQAISIDACVPILEELPETHRTVAKNAMEYGGLKAGQKICGLPIDWAFLGSCTNGRIEDLRIAAEILKGKKIADGVTFYVVPGSEAVRAQAITEGLDKIFIDAGADFRMPGCSMCLAMNDDKVPEAKRCISSSNRNFVGRQGPGSRTHLASPATVATSAIAGSIQAES
jgi:3-isopropylmalate/(R)-2-methylmalate dehydratase large subunit